jgi:hypothetical protein
VWCETLPWAELARPDLARLLTDHGVELLLAVRPWQLPEVADRVDRLRGAGVFVGLWPMLADDDGRWASVASSQAFIALVDALVAGVPAADEIVLDLEPPIALMTRWKDGRPTWRQTPRRPAYRAARDAYVEAVGRWRRGRRVTTAVMPMVVAELRGEWMERLLGTPVSALPVDGHSVMAYTSLFEGWSRGLLDRRRAEVALAVTARLARLRFGDRVGLSLGTVGAGAFGDEPSYRDVGELRRDVAIARAAGIDELSLFDLGGVLRRGPAEAWLEAFVAGAR